MNAAHAIAIVLALAACEADTASLAPADPLEAAQPDAGDAGLDVAMPDMGDAAELARCVYRDDDGGVLPHHCP